MTQRPFAIIPQLPNVDVPFVTQDGYVTDEWRRWLEQQQEITTWQGTDQTLKALLDIVAIDNKGTTTDLIVNADRLKLVGATKNITPFDVTLDKAGFGVDVEIDGDLVVTGTITRGKAGTGFYGARDTWTYQYSSGSRPTQLFKNITTTGPASLDISGTIETTTNNYTLRVGSFLQTETVADVVWHYDRQYDQAQPYTDSIRIVLRDSGGALRTSTDITLVMDLESEPSDEFEAIDLFISEDPAT